MSPSFRNLALGIFRADPALCHRLAQIAMDGTQKIPQRWLETALILKRHTAIAPAIAAAFDAWLWHIEDGRFVDDPHGSDLRSIAATEGRAGVIVHCFTRLWPAYADLAATLPGSSVPSGQDSSTN